MSKELKQMLDDGIGYRTEEFGGSGVRRARDVISFEITELANMDIIAYLNETTGILSGFSDIYYLDDEDDMKYCIDEIMHIILNHFETTDENEINCIWLAPYENVKNIYATTKISIDDIIITTDIDKYIIPEKVMVLSDLGPDGALFAYSSISKIN